jgi:hypothetical protein
MKQTCCRSDAMRAKQKQPIGLAGSSAIKACRRSGHRVHAFRAGFEDRPEYQYPALIERPRFHFRDDSAI